MPLVVAPNMTMPIPFDHVVFDAASEYLATAGTFTATNAGTYLGICSVDDSNLGILEIRLS
jgi:hypothetical protein